MTNATIVSRAQVLVVEDDADARDICESTLRSAGYDVVTVSTVDEAWRAIERRRPDLVVIDRSLPDGSGVELLGRCRVTPRMKDVPFVMITTRSSGDELRAVPDSPPRAVEPSSREPLAVALRAVPRREAVTSAPRRRTTSRASLTLVYPCDDDRTVPVLHEHDGMLQARCRHCMRGSPTLADRAKDAARRAIELGWSPRKDGWACPVCIERHKTARHN